MNAHPFRRRSAKPEQVLALGFLTAILIGGLLLSLPAAGAAGQSIGLLEGFFTATSCVCVTGLTLIDAGTELSLFGQLVMLGLIQLGGLGFMSFATVLMAALGRRISLRGRVLLRESMNQHTLSGMVRLSLIFFAMAVVIEVIGALLLMTRLIPLYGAKQGIWYSFFTAVSAFCNAGFDLFGNWQSLTHLQQEPVILLTLSVLIILGGLGFAVILECLHTRMRWRSLSLHAKVVLLVTFSLLSLGALLTLVLEWTNAATLGAAHLTPANRLINGFFQSVTLRTAGFASIDQASLTDSGKLLGCLFMFVGASSASTGGGIKTTTAALLLLTVWSVIRGRERISVFGREIPTDTVRRSVTIAFIGVMMVLISTCVISVIEQPKGLPLIDLLYETVSAFSTTGLSSVNTPVLSPASHCLLMGLMYLGRVGPLTLALALASRLENSAANRVRYPEEKIMIG